jgi:hypothetical protein
MIVTLKADQRPRSLRQFAQLCRTSAPAEQARRLQQALALAHPGQSPALFQVMIAAGAYESAALALIGKEAAFMLSRSGAGRCIATVLAPGMKAEITGEGATPALALLAAWADARQPASGTRETAAQARPASARLH